MVASQREAAGQERLGGLRRLPLADGWVGLAADGSVAAVEHPVGGRALLLDEHAPGLEQLMHSAARRWGKGFLIVDGLGYRFDAPAALSWRDDGVRLRYDWARCSCTCSGGSADEWSECYELQNPTGQPVTSAASRSARRGGTSTSPAATACSQRRPRPRLDGRRRRLGVGGADGRQSAPGLGLQLTEGELWAYSVESRDHLTGSNVRGHLYLHVDRPRPVRRTPWVGSRDWCCRRAAGTDWPGPLRLVLDLWPTSTPPVRPSSSADGWPVEVGEALELRLAAGAATDVELPLTSASRACATSTCGPATGGGRPDRLLFHPPLRRLAERRGRLPAGPAAPAGAARQPPLRLRALRHPAPG